MKAKHPAHAYVHLKSKFMRCTQNDTTHRVVIHACIFTPKIVNTIGKSVTIHSCCWCYAGDDELAVRCENVHVIARHCFRKCHSVRHHAHKSAAFPKYNRAAGARIISSMDLCWAWGQTNDLMNKII